MKDNYREILEGIKSNVRDGKYWFTIHALERRIERNISRIEIEDAILNGEIIEAYPQDKYSELSYFGIYQGEKAVTYSGFV